MQRRSELSVESASHPAPCPRFYVPGGTLPRDAPSYIPRQADEELCSRLLDGDLCYVLTTRQMGKSSLMVRASVRLRAEGVAVAVLDLTLLGRHLTLEQWYDGLLRQIGRRLNLESEFEAFRREHLSLSPLQRWIAALREVALARLPGKLVVFLDEIDAVRSLPFPTDEFFAALRACYNSRAEDPQMERLTFCVLGVATPSDLIRDTRATPFNIGKRIELTDFANLAPLGAGLGCDARTTTRLLKRVHYWTGGHPYLSQRLCALLAESAASTVHDVDCVCAQAFLTPMAQEQEDNLIFVRDRLLHSEVDLTDLLTLYASVEAGKRTLDDAGSPVVSVLKLSGVVKSENGRLKVRNRIYARVFDRSWIRENLPDAEARRQKAAYRRGAQRASLAAGALLVVFALMAASALREKSRAERGETTARLATIRAGRGEQAARLATRRAEQKQQEAQRNAARAEQLSRREAQTLAAMARERDRAAAAERQALGEQREANTARRQAEESARRERAEAQQEDRASRQANQSARAEAQQRRLAVQQAQIARTQTLAARQNSYVANIALAWQRLEHPAPGTAASVRSLLDSLKPAPGQSDLRGFEWRYLEKLCQRSVTRVQAHRGMVRSLAFSPDQRLLASAGDDATVRLWDVSLHQPIATLRRGITRVLGVAFSPDGKTLATCGSDKAITLWNLATRRPRLIIKGHTEDVNRVAFSMDGRLLASASDDKTVRLWDVGTGAQLAVLIGHTDWVTSVAFAPDGKTLASSGRDGNVFFWDFASRQGSPRATQPGGVTAVAFSSSTQTFYTAGMDARAFRWTSTRHDPMTGHFDQITDLAVADDTALTVSADTVARLWRSGYPCAELNDNTAMLRAAALTRDGHLAAFADDQGGVTFWDLTANREDTAFPLSATDRVYGDARFLPDGRLLTAQVHVNPDSPAQSEIVLEETLSHRRIAGRAMPFDIRSCIALSADGRQIAFTHGEMSLGLWNLADDSVRPLENPIHQALTTVAFSPDGKALAAGFGAGAVLLWEPASGARARILQTHSPETGLPSSGDAGLIRQAVFSPDGRLLAAVNNSGVVRLWSVPEGRPLRDLRGSAGLGQRQCAFSPDSRLLAVTGNSSAVSLWDVRAGTLRTLRTEHIGAMEGLAFSPDGRTLATTSLEGRVRLWNVATLQEVAIFAMGGMSLPPYALIPGSICVFSPDGRRLAVFSNSLGCLYDTCPN